MDTFLEWKIVVGRRRFTSGHRMVGEEEEDRNYHGSWRNQVTDFMKIRNIEEAMAEDRHINIFGSEWTAPIY